MTFECENTWTNSLRLNKRTHLRTMIRHRYNNHPRMCRHLRRHQAAINHPSTRNQMCPLKKKSRETIFRTVWRSPKRSMLKFRCRVPSRTKELSTRWFLTSLAIKLNYLMWTRWVYSIYSGNNISMIMATARTLRCPKTREASSYITCARPARPKQSR